MSTQAIAPAPRTPSGRIITADWYYDSGYDFTAEQIIAVNTAVWDGYGLHPLDDPTPKYNCHPYAWHLQSTNNLYWIDSPVDYIKDPLVSKVSSPSIGDRIVYQYQSGIQLTYEHSGVITDNTKYGPMVTSKWGEWGLYEHTVFNCPADYGRIVTYYTID